MKWNFFNHWKDFSAYFSIIHIRLVHFFVHNFIYRINFTDFCFTRPFSCLRKITVSEDLTPLLLCLRYSYLWGSSKCFLPFVVLPTALTTLFLQNLYNFAIGLSVALRKSQISDLLFFSRDISSFSRHMNHFECES